MVYASAWRSPRNRETLGSIIFSDIINKVFIQARKPV